MLCPACQAENVESARFCMGCGARLSQECPQCQARLPIQARFCPECGAALSVASVDKHPATGSDRLPSDAGSDLGLPAHLQRLVPKEYVERLLATRGQSSNERRQVTNLFADVKGSTAMAERLDPEEVLEIMNGAFAALIEPVYRHEGTLARLMGDAVLAFFGAPLSHEDDPERAVRTALEMVAGIQKYAACLEQERGLHGFNVRVGINTGLVVVGEVGSDLRVEYTAMGDAINLAARMEQNAPVGGVLLSQDTYRHVRGLFDVAVQEPLLVKGKSEPVQTYVALRARPRQFRMPTRGIEGIETRLVGREVELMALQNHLRDAIEESQAHIVTVAGDAGVGKSRLLYEFENWLGLWEQPLAFFHGHARPESQGHSYNLLRSLFAARFDIQETDSAEAVRQKFQAGCAGLLYPAQADLAAHLVGFDVAGAAFSVGSSQPGQGSASSLALDSLVDYFRQVTQQSGAVIFLEDIHWADAASLDFIDQLVTEIPRAPLLVVCLARPALYEQRPNWGEGQENHSRLDLGALSRRSARQLIAELLQKAPEIPPRLEEVILTSAEGNPYYAEELVKMLLENGVIDAGEDAWCIHAERLETLRVPPTLAGILQARFDALQPEEKTLLQQASVAGREFWDALLAALDEQTNSQELDHRLKSLRERALIFQHERSTLSGAREYTFKHAILRDTVYESVLLKQRRLYHAQVAAWLEKNSGDRQREYLNLIAHHYELAGEFEKSSRFWAQAGEAAGKLGIDEEALSHYKHALQLTPAGQIARRAELLMEIGHQQINLEEDQAKATLEQALSLAQQVQDWRVASNACAELGILTAFVLEQLPAGLEYERQALEMAERIQDPDQIAQVLTLIGIMHVFQGAESDGLGDFERSVAYYRRGSQDDTDFMRVLSILTRHALDEGRSEQAQQYLEDAQAYIDRTNNQGARMELMRLQGVVAGYAGDDKGEEQIERQRLVAAREIGHRTHVIDAIDTIVQACYRQGDYAEAERMAAQGLEAARLWKKSYNIEGFLAVLGQIAQARGKQVEAQSWFEQALSLNQAKEQNPINLAKAGRFYTHIGEQDKADDLFQRALQMCPAGIDSVDLGHILAHMLGPLVQRGWSETACDILGVLETMKVIVSRITMRVYCEPPRLQLQAMLPVEQYTAALARGKAMGAEALRQKLMAQLEKAPEQG